MNRNNVFAATFGAMALAAPFLLFLLYRWSANSPENQGSALAGAVLFVLWIVSCFFVGIPLLALAAACWDPVANGLRALRKLLLTVLGAGSLIAAVVMLGYVATRADTVQQVLVGGIPGSLALFAGSWAMYEVMLPGLGHGPAHPG